MDLIREPLVEAAADPDSDAVDPPLHANTEAAAMNSIPKKI